MLRVSSSNNTLLGTAFPWLCPSFCGLHYWVADTAPLCGLSILPRWEPRRDLGFRRKPHKKCMIWFKFFTLSIPIPCWSHLSIWYILFWISKAPFGPPFALIQGTLETVGTKFKKIPTEHCPTIRSGSVAWIGSGPEFFISLANHEEWKNSYTVFGSVLLEDMKIAEKIAHLPTKPDVWNNVNVSVLQDPVPLLIQRMKTSRGQV